MCFAFIAVFFHSHPQSHNLYLLWLLNEKLQRNVTVNNKERMKTKTAVLSVGKFKFWSFVFVWPCLISKLTLHFFLFRIILIGALVVFTTCTTPVRMLLIRTDTRRSTTVSSTDDHVLSGYTIHKQRTYDFLSCAQLCLAHPNCMSFNYENIDLNGLPRFIRKCMKSWLAQGSLGRQVILLPKVPLVLTNK